MNTTTLGTGFGALTEEEQVSIVGGNTSLAYMLGYGLGYAAAVVEAAILVGRAMDPTIHGSVPYAYFASF
jgi:hypothetical protein